MQVEIVGDTGVLSEEGHTPRQGFIRKMLAMGRMPVPILLRDPSALQDLNLAHRGLGDDVMCAAAEVTQEKFYESLDQIELTRTLSLGFG